MNVTEAIVGRQSTRAFQKDTPVTQETLARVFEIASRAPSGSNIQPWKVWVVTGARKSALSEACLNKHFANVEPKREYNYYPVTWRSPYIERRRACGWGLYETLGIQKGEKDKMSLQHARNYSFFDAPVGVFFTIDRDMELGSWLDTGMFIQSVMLAAREFGLETCPQAAFCNYYDVVTEHLGVPDEQMLVCGMSIGYPKRNASVNTFRTARLDVSEFVTFIDQDEWS
ncbi:MAG: nitroreductase [Hyphomicrobiaceae bacterium]